MSKDVWLFGAGMAAAVVILVCARLLLPSGWQTRAVAVALVVVSLSWMWAAFRR